MANVNILNLPVAVSIDGTEYVPAVQGDVTRRIATGLMMSGSASQSTQSANTVLAGPTSGSANTPSFRALVAADIPASSINISVGVTPISSGTSGRILYDSAGILAQYAISGTGAVAMTTSPSLVTPDLGVPSAGILTACTGLPISTGVSGLGTGVATFLGTPSSANLATAVTDETGSGSLVFATSPTFVTPLLGTPTSGVLTNCTGLPATTGITGILPGANGGTGVANTSKTITVSGNTTIGSSTNTVAFVTTNNTSVTLPTTGTLATLAGSESLSNKTLVSPVITTSPTAAGATWTNLGTVTTVALATVTGTIDMGGATSLEVPNSGAPTISVDGQIAVDTTVTDFAQGVLKYYATAEMGVVAMPVAQFGSPGNGAVPTYNSSTDRFELTVPAGSGDVVGPASATDNAVVLFDSTTGKLIKNSTIQFASNALSPTVDGAASLGTTSLGWQNLFGNTGFVANIENGNWVATHTSGILTVGTGDLRVTNNFTDATSVVTVGGAQTLTNKTLTSPTLTTPALGTPASGVLTNCTGVNAAGITTTIPPLGMTVPVNCALVGTVAANALTIAVKGANGSDPSATNPVLFPFRSATATTGTPVWQTLTAAHSLVVPDTALLGTVNSVPFRLWIVEFDDASTFRLGVIQRITGGTTPTATAAVADNNLASSTTIGTGSDSAGVFYTGTGVTTKAYRIIGYMDWASGLATAGTWSSGPTTIQLFGPGVPRPGEPTGNTVLIRNVAVTNTTSSTFQSTGSTVDISLTSAPNLVQAEYCGQLSTNLGTNEVFATLFRGSTAIGPASGTYTSATGVGLVLTSVAGMQLDAPGTVAATTYVMKVCNQDNTTSVGYPRNSEGCGNILKLTELMA